MKKLRGLKRKWPLMLTQLDNLAEKNDSAQDEIFIATSFSYFKRKITTSYKNELTDKLLALLYKKQRQNRKKYYLLWYLPEDLFESTLLIFNDFADLTTFFKERQISRGKPDHYLLALNKKPPLETYLTTQVAPEELLAVTGILKEEPKDRVSILLVADKKIIALAKKELS